MTKPIIPLAYYVLGVGIFVIILIAIAGLIVFHKDQTNRRLKRRIDKEEEDEFMFDNRFLELLKATRKEELERRNEFWSNSNQAIIVALIIAIITALLFTNKIDPDAGLPIISALSGFAIAKTVQSQKYRNERNE